MIHRSKPAEPRQSQRHAEARAWLSQQGNAILRDQIEIARTAAPPFAEDERRDLIAGMLASHDIVAERDPVGNLLVGCSDNGHPVGSSPVVVAAHLDTVFGPDVPIEVRRSGDRWVGPGVADNARGLAVTVALLRAFAAVDARPTRAILFAFTVGEEGSGNLRGVRHLFQDDSPLRNAKAFIAIDGSGLQRIVHRALGSRRLRITVRGPGGHSWADWGRPNPAVVTGELTHRLTRLPLPLEPRVTLTVARLGGGTSINAIPTEAWLELDIRSESAEALDRIESEVRSALEDSVAGERSRTDGRLGAEIEKIGERPAGSLDISHPLLDAAREATRALGREPEASISSTDANVPMSLGIPSIGIGGGGESGDTHTTHEWFQDTDGAQGAVRALDILARIAGV